MRELTQQELQHRFQTVYDEICNMLNICAERYFPSGYNEYFYKKQMLEELSYALGGVLLKVRPTPGYRKTNCRQTEEE